MASARCREVTIFLQQLRQLPSQVAGSSGAMMGAVDMSVSFSLASRGGRPEGGPISSLLPTTGRRPKMEGLPELP
jgi:hypothetical protein